MKAVYVQAIEHVADVDENLSTPHAFQEVAWPSHLGHEFGKDHGASIGVHRLHGTVESSRKAARTRKTATVLYGRVLPVDRRDERETDGGAGGLFGGGIQRRGMRGGAHCDEHDRQVDEHCHVRQPTEFLQGSNLAEDESGQGPDQAANGIAQLELDRFRQRLAVGDDDGPDVANELDGLEDVEEVAAPGTVYTESDVSEGFDRELV